MYRATKISEELVSKFKENKSNFVCFNEYLSALISKENALTKYCNNAIFVISCDKNDNELAACYFENSNDQIIRFLGEPEVIFAANSVFLIENVSENR